MRWKEATWGVVRGGNRGVEVRKEGKVSRVGKERQGKVNSGMEGGVG